MEDLKISTVCVVSMINAVSAVYDVAVKWKKTNQQGVHGGEPHSN